MCKVDSAHTVYEVDMDFDFADLTLDDDAFDKLIRETVEDTNGDTDVSHGVYKMCENCNVEMFPDINNMLLCKQCGLVQQCITDNSNYEPSMNGYNTNSTQHIPIRCVGKDAFKYQHELRVSTSQYAVIQESNLRRQLESRNFKSENLMIPKSVITSAIEQYKLIRKTSKIHRGDVLKGILASIIYYECLKQGIVRKPKEICEWYDIGENDMSKGDKILRALEEKKVLDLPINDDNDAEYVSSYLKRMNMSMDFKQTMLEILVRLDKLRIGNPNARLSTKVSALVFMFTIANGIDIQAEDISREFNIAVSTFKAFYSDMIKKKALLQDIFDKYGVIIPDKLPRKRRKVAQ